MYSIGIDSGSRFTKVCLFNTNTNEIIHCSKQESSLNHEKQFTDIYQKIMKQYDIKDNEINSIICTGYGRKNYSKATKYSSEIICHARGANHFNNNIRTVIDIGGQDTKIIKTAKEGKVIDFVMNDKCAAGTGRFVEKIADLFSVKIEDLDKYAQNMQNEIEISNTCVVFAESEIISLISTGVKKEDIIYSIIKSIAHRILSIGNQLSYENDIALVGGLSKNYTIKECLEEIINTNIYIPDLSEYTGAIGAAKESI